MNMNEFIFSSLNKKGQKSLVLTNDTAVSEELQYHIDNNLTLCENVFRIYSKKYFDLLEEVRNLWIMGDIKLNYDDSELVKSDLGRKVMVNEEIIYLDAPFVDNDDDFLIEAKHRGKDVKLNKPFRTPGGPKKFAVYVKTPSGGIKKVTFGDPNLKVKNDNPKAAKSFRARHKCSEKKDKTTAGYWSCSVGRYAKALGLKSNKSW